MSWQRAPVASAIAATLTAATEGAVSAFADPPPTFNVPAYIVSWPITVVYNTPVFGVDVATVAVICAAGVDSAGQVDDMATVAISALSDDRTLGGLLAQGDLAVVEQRNWRVLADVGGARFLAADVICEIRM